MPSALPTLDYERTSNGTITSHMVADLNRCSIALKDRRTHFAKTIFADLLRTLRRTCNKVDIVSLVPVLQKEDTWRYCNGREARAVLGMKRLVHMQQKEDT